MKLYLLSIYQPESASAYEEAIVRTENAPEREFLQRRRGMVNASPR
jgi:hypothetical protein